MCLHREQSFSCFDVRVDSKPHTEAAYSSGPRWVSTFFLAIVIMCRPKKLRPSSEIARTSQILTCYSTLAFWLTYRSHVSDRLSLELAVGRRRSGCKAREGLPNVRPKVSPHQLAKSDLAATLDPPFRLRSVSFPLRRAARPPSLVKARFFVSTAVVFGTLWAHSAAASLHWGDP